MAPTKRAARPKKIKLKKKRDASKDSIIGEHVAFPISGDESPEWLRTNKQVAQHATDFGGVKYLLTTVAKKEKQLYVIEWNATIIDRVSMSNMGELCGAIAKHKSLRKNRGKRSRLKLLRHFREFQMN